MENSISIKKVNSSQDFHALREEWNHLLAQSPADNYFLRWEWLWNWWEVYQENDSELSILLVYRGSDLIGIGPFYLKHHTYKKIYSIRRLMFLGTKEGSVISEYMDVIYREGEDAIVIQKIMEFISAENLCDDLYFQQMDTSSRTVPILRQTGVERKWLVTGYNEVESPYINLPADWDGFLEKCSSSMRYKIKRDRRKLMSYPEVMIRKTLSPVELEKDFPELVCLHQQRWEGRRQPGSFSGNKFYLFQKTIMHEMLRNGYLELWFLSVGGKNIAAMYNISYKNKIYFFQSGLDISFDKQFSPGLLLHSYCIENSIKEGLMEYDFMLMGNTDGYKKRWTSEYRKLSDIYVVRSQVMKALTIVSDTIGSVRAVVRQRY